MKPDAAEAKRISRSFFLSAILLIWSWVRLPVASVPSSVISFGSSCTNLNNVFKVRALADSLMPKSFLPMFCRT